jgi:hypothetical protein
MDLKGITKAQKFHLQKSMIKTMLITFFDKQGVIHKKCMVIGRLLKRISRMRAQFRAEGSWFLLHDNAPPHSALVLKIFLAKHGVVEIIYAPHSPDLAPANFSLSRGENCPTKGKRFQDVEDITKNVTPELNALVFKNFLNDATNVLK